MENKKDLPTRKKNRLQHYDYSSCGVYFITIGTDKRNSTLSRIVGDDVLGVPTTITFMIIKRKHRKSILQCFLYIIESSSKDYF